MWIIIIQAILSWLVAFNVINTHNHFVRSLLHALDRITAPLYRPIRRIMPDFGGLDFSPMVDPPADLRAAHPAGRCGQRSHALARGFR